MNPRPARAHGRVGRLRHRLRRLGCDPRREGGPSIVCKAMRALLRLDHGEKLLAGLGGFAGILLVFAVSGPLLVPGGGLYLVASMGASAVLLFAAPHGPLSQPWPVIGGNTLSAVIGMACYQWVPETWLAAPLAVALSITAMHYLKCLHPPGGATALTAVIGGDPIHALGYAYALYPVAVCAVMLVAVAILFNAPQPWRRYPLSLALAVQPEKGGDKPPAPTGISRADLEFALERLHAFVDVSEEELMQIYSLAVDHARHHTLGADDIEVGACYSNGRFGEAWSVRKVLEAAGAGPEGQVRYKVMAGAGRGRTGQTTRRELAHWARSRVTRQDTLWRIVAGNHA